MIPLWKDDKDEELSPEWTTFLKEVKILAQEQDDQQKDVSIVINKADDSTQPAKPKTFSAKSVAPFNAVFDSSSNNATFGTPDVAVGEDSKGMVLALSSADNTGHPLPNALEELQVDVSENDTVNSIVNFIAKTTNVVVDTRPELRNAIWFLPGDTMQVTTALSFQLAPDAAKLQAVLNQASQVLVTDFDLKLGDSDFTKGSIGLSIRSTTFCVLDPVDSTVTKPFISNTFVITISLALKGFVFSIEYSPGEIHLNVREDPNWGSEGLFSRLSKLGHNAPLAADLKPEFDSNATSMDNADNASNEHDSVFGDFHLWSITIGKNDWGGFWWEVAFAVQWKASTQSIWLGLSYDSRTSIFTGNLLFKGMFPTDEQKLLPGWSNLLYPPGVDIDGLPDGLDIPSLFSDTATLPTGVPRHIKELIVMFNKRDKVIAFTTTIESAAPAEASPVPAPFAWDSVTLEVSKKQQSNPDIQLLTTFTLNPSEADAAKYTPASLAAQLMFVDGSWTLKGSVRDFQLGVLIDYADPSCNNGFVGVLGKLVIRKLDVDYTFDSGVASSFLFTGTIELGQLELDLTYQYASHTADKTAVDKAIAADPTALGKYAKPLPKPTKDTSWSFEAYLGASVENATIGSIADSIMDGAADILPSWVADIKISPSADKDTCPVILKVAKPPSKDSDPPTSGDSATEGAENGGADKVKSASVVLTLKVRIESFELTFVQISDNGTPVKTADNKPELATNGKPKVIAPKPKRAMRLTVSEIPLLKDIPVVQELPQPFEKLVYMWVSDTGAFTAKDVENVNTQLEDSAKLLYKKTKDKSANKPDTPAAAKAPASDAKPDDDPVALAVGHHFMVVQHGEVVLDHVFKNAKSRTPAATGAPAGGADTHNSQGTGGDQDDSSNTDADADAKADPAPTKGEVTKQTKLLTISSVSLQFKDGMLNISIDATVALGPISLSLLGFTVGLPLGKADVKFTLDNLAPMVNAITVDLKGMAVSFEKPPLLLAGVFEHELLSIGDPAVTQDAYRGGIGISFPPYTFVAVGEYSKVIDKGHEYKSFFVFAKLDGPLITLEFATISGVRMGFGYNSSVRSPAIDELTDFPLISDNGVSGAGNNPMKILNSLVKGANPWVTPKEHAYWFAIGMTITAFDILSITAAAVLAFKDAGIVVSLYADAIAQMPPGVHDTSQMILYVEIGIVAEMNFVDSYFRCEASLAPTSFLLVPQCHLYGGFALCYWFGNNAHAGDWVFSIGGYHRMFDKPAHYPDVKRLGISFVVGDNVTITGEGYFAITPKVAMGGAMIHVSLSVGPVSAYLDASFDALINFHPIHYQADLSIAIGVTFDADILFIHIHISVHVGADLHIEGPEFGGVAHVDFWLFGFDVYFGEHAGLPPPLPLGGDTGFYQLVHKAGPAGGNVPVADTASKNLDMHIKHSLETGNFPMPARDSGTAAPSGGAGTKWHVKGGSFAFRIAPDFAITGATVATKASDDLKVKNKASTDPKVKNSYLQKVQNIPTPMVATSKGPTPLDIQQVFSTPMHLAAGMQLTSPLEVTIRRLIGTTKEVIEGWQPEYVVKDVPKALWGAYDSALDPAHNKPGRDSPLLNTTDQTVKLAMGVSLKAPLPQLSESLIPAFNATEAQKYQIERPGGGPWLLPKTPDDQSTMLPAENNFDLETMSVPDRIKQWDTVKNGWVSIAKNQASMAADLASLCMSTLGWDQPAPEVVTEAKAAGIIPWQLQTALPKRLVAGTGTKTLADTVNGLENFYLDLPRIAPAA